MVLYLKVNQKIWGAGDYSDQDANALTGVVYSEETLTTVFDFSAGGGGWTAKIKVYIQSEPQGYILSDTATIDAGSTGTWKYKPTINKMEPSGLYQVVLQLTKGNERITAIGINGSAEILIKRVPTIT